ncbi:MAG: uracil-DNA glycosylase family protein [Bacteroidales bacterium]
MNTPKIEHHPLQPFLPPSARVLMLGSFPPKQNRWSMNFFYPNMQNDMWRIFGLIFFKNSDHFIREWVADDKQIKGYDADKIKAFCEGRGIALSDTASAVVRHKDNASDKYLEVAEKVNLEKLLKQIPECIAIVTTGQKATETILEILSSPENEIDIPEPKIGSYTEFSYLNRQMRLYRMPSTSRAYPKPLREKADVYRKMFEELARP